MPKLATLALFAAAIYAGMLVQQAILRRQGYTIKFNALGKGDA
jgi:hypothetical protein